MPHLLDLDIAILHLSGERSVDEVVRVFIPNGIAISVITYMEVLQGILSSDQIRSAQISFDSFVAGIPVLPVSVEIAEHCAVLRNDLKRREKRVRPRSLDLLVASTAIFHRLTLVTKNARDYDDIDGLDLLVP